MIPTDPDAVARIADATPSWVGKMLAASGNLELSASNIASRVGTNTMSVANVVRRRKDFWSIEKTTKGNLYRLTPLGLAVREHLERGS